MSDGEEVSVRVPTNNSGSNNLISATPITITTQSLSYWVPNKNAKRKFICCGPTKGDEPIEKRVLNAVNFEAKAGQLTAVMGPSGSGKTTLLDCLAGRTHVGRSEGDILLNGIAVSDLDVKLKSLTGYVKQKDLLFSTATVRETITYAAKMRLPVSMTESEKLDRVEAMITELGLNKCADTRLGSAADGGGGQVKGGSDRGVSGGELKRVALAVELITQPSLLLLDEPTSGLDAAAALSLIQLLKRLADEGCTIITTLHQPRSSIWRLFDKAVLMNDGEIVFAGAPADAIEFFAHNGWKCPSFTNPADYLIDVIAGRVQDEDEEAEAESTGKRRSVSRMAKRFKKKSQKNTEKLVSGADIAASKRSLTTSVQKIHAQLPGFLQQFAVLFIRAWRNNVRHPLILLAQLSQHVFLAIFVGLMYLRLGEKSLTTNLSDNSTVVTDRLAAIFFALLNVSFVAGFADVMTFPAERPIFNRERASGHYGVLAYYLALSLSNLPIQIVLVTVNATVAYWMMGLRANGVAYIIFVAMSMLSTLTLQGLCLIVSALSSSVDVANMAASMVLLVCASFGGFFLSFNNIPPYFKPFEYLSPFKYAFHAMAVNDLTGLQFNCATPSVVGNSTAPAAPLFCPYPDGETALIFFGMNQGSIGIDAAVLGGMFVVYRIAVYLLLLFVKVGAD